MTEDNYMQDQDPVIVDTKEETDKKCPACGGTMEFDPKTGMLNCPYCGTTKEIEVENKSFVAEELDFFGSVEGDSCDWGTETKSVICKGCGAETIYEAKDIANVCPYCGSTQVMEASAKKVMAPGGVITFAITAKEAAARFTSWIAKKFFCPKLAKQSARPAAFKGLYIPYWTFDANTSSNYFGQFGRARTVKTSDGKTQTKIDWYPTSGTYLESFDDILVCGSKDRAEALLSNVEPFDTTKAVEYKPEYMAGFIAESYTIRAKTAWETAKSKMAQFIRDGVRGKIQRDHGTSHANVLSVQTSYRNVTYKYLLLPVWISSYQYKGKVYRFIINGQTGKVSGKTPISWVKVGIVTLAVIAAIAMIVLMLEGF